MRARSREPAAWCASMPPPEAKFGQSAAQRRHVRTSTRTPRRRSIAITSVSFLLPHGNDSCVAQRLKMAEELWLLRRFESKGGSMPTLRFVASPVAVPGFIVVPTAKNYGVVYLKPDGQGDITDKAEFSHWRWNSNTPDVPSPLVAGDSLPVPRKRQPYLRRCQDREGDLYAADSTRTRHRASPVFADGNIYQPPAIAR